MGNRPPHSPSIPPSSHTHKKNSVNLQQKFYGTLGGLSPRDWATRVALLLTLHTKLPKWSLWDFIDVGKDRSRCSRDGRREKYLAEGLSLLSPPKVDDNHLDDRSCAAAAEHFHQLIVVCRDMRARGGENTIYDQA